MRDLIMCRVGTKKILWYHPFKTAPFNQVLPEMKVQNLVQLKLFEGRRKETIDKLWNITGELFNI